METIIALGGNPNSGKTTLFNELTGARQHVGNYPGVTVDKKEGIYNYNGYRLNIVDLPGTYSLTAYSIEEVVARDFLVAQKPEVTINIVDASNLERNLYFTIQLLELGIPVCIALNMMDVAKSRGITINHHKLSSILQIPVVPIVARTGEGKLELMKTVAELARKKKERKPLVISYGADLEEAISQMQKKIESEHFMTLLYPARWIAIKYLENDAQILKKGKETDPVIAKTLEEHVSKVSRHIQQTAETYPEALIADCRYGYISSLLKQEVMHQQYDEDRLYTSDKIDKVLTNRFIGPVIMLLILMGLYQFTFTYSEIPVGLTENFFGWLGEITYNSLPDGLLRSLIISGVIDGVGGVLGFAPLIMFMFFGIAILEDSGYLARVAYMLDRIFRVFGLHGSSVMAYIISGGIAGGCAVPGVMATRTLRSPKERLATLLTVPFMNCGAKLPVFALLIAAFFNKNEAIMMFAITIIAWIGALIIAKILRLTIIKGDPTPFIMELPPYRLPTFKGVMIHTWERTWQYIKKAGTVILGISVVLWAMMSFPGMPDSEVKRFEQQREALKSLELSPSQLEEKMAEIEHEEAATPLRYSIAGRIGIALESITQFAGFDWRTNIALLGGFAAKEVVVSTLGTAYSLGELDPEESGSLAEKLASSPEWNPVVALSLIIFTIFYAPCFVAVVCISREAGSWKWGAFSMIFNTAVAFSFAVAVFQIGSLITK
ncbi:MAG: ferrous iron transport protein B [Desulfamplus sp.]|nr:ferrous iron transport protein B [Desulfamplus sp.]